MNYIEAKYLKSQGQKINVKVSIAVLDKTILIHIRDYELYDFKSALRCLQQIEAAERVYIDLEVL